MAEDNSVRPVNLGYFAGFFDGEGTILINRGFSHHGRPKYVLLVKVANTFPDIVFRFKAIWGGSIYLKKKEQPHHKQAYFWSLNTRKAHRFLLEIAPYLVVKKGEAEVALEFYATQKIVNASRMKRSSKSRYTEEEYGKLASVRNRLLNMRGGSHNRLVYPMELKHV